MRETFLQLQLDFSLLVIIGVKGLALDALYSISPVMDWCPIQTTVFSVTPTKIKRSLKTNDKRINKQLRQVN